MLRAVEKPMVSSVLPTSLSIVPGIPTQTIPCLLKACKPLKVPSPPIPIKASISKSFKLSAAFLFTAQRFLKKLIM